eukprot:TRINITY_DN9226_c0_g1_i1.p1 TRINITY_DN9226_c0_g1~~TRINITY_DN9226_c0_g1_i1.p1  ORF type:complete len:295 (-),score=87.53 TRINITY_DN9226_c0_g1_i1:69-848(-)
MNMINKEVKGLIYPKFLCVLNDTPSDSKNKYLVMEWVEGDTMKVFKEKFLKKNQFREEKHFVLMVLSFFHQLKILHKSKIIHYDIKPENMMFTEIDNQLIFFFIDFGSAYQIDSKYGRVNTFSPGFSPPEQDPNNKEYYDKKLITPLSDIYSLAKTLIYVKRVSGVTCSQKIDQLFQEMIQDEYKKRPPIEDCIDFFKKNYEVNYEEYLENMEVLKDFSLCKNSLCITVKQSTIVESPVLSLSNNRIIEFEDTNDPVLL